MAVSVNELNSQIIQPWNLSQHFGSTHHICIVHISHSTPSLAGSLEGFVYDGPLVNDECGLESELAGCDCVPVRLHALSRSMGCSCVQSREKGGEGRYSGHRLEMTEKAA